MSLSAQRGVAVSTVTEPQRLEFDAPVDALDVRIVGGIVNVVGTDGPGARVEVAQIEGPPLVVRRDGSRLQVVYEDLPWAGFRALLDPGGARRVAVLTVSLPAAARVDVGVVTASAVLSGIGGRATVRSVSGGVTLAGLTGEVAVDTVSGSVETQALRGSLRTGSVSGDLTVVDGGATSVRADTVSGDVVLDLDDTAKGADIRLHSVAGEIAVRLAEPADATVEASTASGAVASAFDELRVDGRWGAKRLSGRLGDGTGQLKATTVTGAVTLLRRPPGEGPTPTPHSSLRKDV